MIVAGQEPSPLGWSSGTPHGEPLCAGNSAGQAAETPEGPARPRYCLLCGLKRSHWKGCPNDGQPLADWLRGPNW